MFSFCLAPGLFGFIFLSVSSACSVFVSSCLLRLHSGRLSAQNYKKIYSKILRPAARNPFLSSRLLVFFCLLVFSSSYNFLFNFLIILRPSRADPLNLVH